jgi:hypothetical protein
MAASEIARLLSEAAAAPFGPLTVAIEASEPASWQLRLAWHDMTSTAGLSLDEAADTLRCDVQVACDSEDGAWKRTLLARPWVIDGTPATGGGLSLRLWLRASTLEGNTLLRALAELARLGELLGATESAAPAPPPPAAAPAPATPAAEPSSPAGAPATPTWPAPAQQPAPAPRPEPWQSLTAPPPEPDAPAPTPGPGPAQGGYCRECGSPYQPDHAFCTNCGARLN